MPNKNVVRKFVPESVYHCYNRGVERRLIFMDQQDYGVFMNRLKQLLANPEELRRDFPDKKEHLQSFYGDIELLAFCLMPNHFHILLYQKNERSVAEFMRALSTSYTMYFNNRYKRVGSLFQGTYKSRLIDSEPYWQHISRYIHLNCEALGYQLQEYPYSSIKYYSNSFKVSWLKPERVLEGFDSYTDYLKFNTEYSSKIEQLHDELSLE